MSSKASIWLVLAIVTVVIGGDVLVARSSIRAHRHVQGELSRAMADLQQRIQALSSSFAGLLRRAHQERTTVPSPPVRDAPTLAFQDVEPVDSSPETESPAAETSEPPLERLALPPGMTAQSILDMELPDLLKDVRLNPDQVKLTQIESRRAAEEILMARAKKKLLDSEIRLAVAEAMEVLRDRGEFVPYWKGQRAEGIPGVFSAAEMIDGERGRLFHLFPDECPEIYEKRRERREVVRSAVRTVLAMLER